MALRMPILSGSPITSGRCRLTPLKARLNQIVLIPFGNDLPCQIFLSLAERDISESQTCLDLFNKASQLSYMTTCQMVMPNS
jgi:hypothetical protein